MYVMIGWNCLHLAVLGGFHAASAKIIDQCKDLVNTSNPHNEWTALHIAVSKNDVNITKLLLSEGASVNATSICILLFLFLTFPSFFSAALAGHSALIIAACNGSMELCRILHENGADLDLKTSSKLETGLWLAARNGHLDIVKFLVEKGADFRAVTSSGKQKLCAIIIL